MSFFKSCSCSSILIAFTFFSAAFLVSASDFDLDINILNSQKTTLQGKVKELTKQALNNPAQRETIASQIEDLNKQISTTEELIKRTRVRQDSKKQQEGVDEKAKKVLEEGPAKTDKLLKDLKKLENQPPEARRANVRRRYQLSQRIDRLAGKEEWAEYSLMGRKAQKKQLEAKLQRKGGKLRGGAGNAVMMGVSATQGYYESRLEEINKTLYGQIGTKATDYGPFSRLFIIKPREELIGLADKINYFQKLKNENSLSEADQKKLEKWKFQFNKLMEEKQSIELWLDASNKTLF